MQNNENRSVFTLPSDNEWMKERFLFDKFIALKEAQTTEARRAICDQVSAIFSNHSHKAELLQKYKDLFLNDINLQILLAGIDDIGLLDNQTITAAANDLLDKLNDKEGQLGTREKVATKRQELFEYQVFYEKQEELYPYFLTSNEAEPEYSKLELRMQNLSTQYSSSVELEKDDVGFLFYSTCAWLSEGKESVESLRRKIEFLGCELNYDSKKLNEEQKLFILKKLQASKPIMITLTNGYHHVSVQILEVKGQLEVHLFDGMHPRDKSYAIDWVKDLHDFLKKQSGKNVKDEIVDKHLFVQHSVNCGLTSAIGGACVMMHADTKGTFDKLRELSTFYSNHAWNKIPFILNAKIFTKELVIKDFRFSLNPNAFLFFPETCAQVDLLRTLHCIRNNTLKDHSSIPGLNKFSQTTFSDFELFLYCLFSESFFRSELNDFAKVAYAYNTAVDTKHTIDEDLDVDDKVATPKSTANSQTPQEFLNNIYSSDLVRLMNNISTPSENSFAYSVSQIALALLCAVACVLVFKNDISFSSLSNSFSR